MRAETTDLLYRTVAAEIAASIDRRVLPPGARLPSVRSFSASRGVSVPTVVEAYHLLEDEGLVESRPRSGYYVRAPAPALVSAATRGPIGEPVQVRSVHLAERAPMTPSLPGVLPFGAAIPSPAFFPVRRLKAIMNDVLRRDPALLGSYAFAPGLPALRRQIARRALAWGCVLDADQIVVTNGAVEAIHLCLQTVTKPGDIVAVEAPCYYGFLRLLEAMNLQALEIPTRPCGGLCVESLADAIARHPVRACLISTTVTNPTGATMPDGAKRRLVDILSARGVPLIEDATFADLQQTGTPTAAKTFDRTGQVMLCASLTKTIAPGLRLGWVEGGRYADRIALLKRVSSIGQPALIQETLARYLDKGGLDRHLRTLRGTFAGLVLQHTRAVAEHFPAGSCVEQPSGGFLLWVELPSGIDTQALHEHALSIGLGLAPGAMFSASNAFAHAVRINCGIEWTAATEQAYADYGMLLKTI
jgi:DNA-binding transcriptional MocR family regulator